MEFARKTAGIVALGLVAVSLGAGAAPSVATVAEGYADWTGAEPKNRFMGRLLSASDFRHRVTVFILLQADPKDESGKKLGDQLRAVRQLTALVNFSRSAFNWEAEEKLPRDRLIVAVINGKCTYKQMRAVLEPRSEDEIEKNLASEWANVHFYSNVEIVNGPDPEGRYPYVYVMGPSGTAPCWKGAYGNDVYKPICAAVAEATDKMEEWTPLTGVAESQFFKKEHAALRSGKPVQGVLDKLKKGIGDANAEKAKEAQVMYDAICQYRSDLLFRIEEESYQCPARAYVDLQRLLALFPQEKKNLQTVNAKLKSNKSVATLGRMLEKILEWRRSDFAFKNAAEAKKAVQLVNTWRKPLEKMSTDQTDVALGGEVAIILSQLDELAETLLTKVPQK